jgi:hypothetical protein
LKDLLDQLVQLERKVTRALEFKFLVLTTQFKNLKQLSQQETQARDTWFRVTFTFGMTLMSLGKMLETFKGQLAQRVLRVLLVLQDRLVTRASLETLQLLLILHRHPQTTEMLGLIAATVRHTFTMIPSGLKLARPPWDQQALKEIQVQQVQIAMSRARQVRQDRQASEELLDLLVQQDLQDLRVLTVR